MIPREENDVDQETRVAAKQIEEKGRKNHNLRLHPMKLVSALSQSAEFPFFRCNQSYRRSEKGKSEEFSGRDDGRV